TSARMMKTQRSTHSLQMNASGPATTLRTSASDLPQKEQRIASGPRPAGSLLECNLTLRRFYAQNRLEQPHGCEKNGDLTPPATASTVNGLHEDSTARAAHRCTGDWRQRCHDGSHKRAYRPGD